MNRILILLVCVSLCGCAVLRKSAIGISREELKNAETAREVAENYLQTWPIQSGFIKGALGPRLDELPVQAIDAINELDELVAKDPNEIADYELGMSLGLRIRILSSIVMEALKMYAPDVFDYVPLLF